MSSIITHKLLIAEVVLLSFSCSSSLYFSLPTVDATSASFLDVQSDPDYKTYENSTYHVRVDYPKNWTYFNDVDLEAPLIFRVIFLPPFELENPDPSGSIAVEISEEKNSTSLEQLKNLVIKNLEENDQVVKDVSFSATTLNGEPAYRIEGTMWLDYWAKIIKIYAMKDGKIYTIGLDTKPEEIGKYSQSFEKMSESLKIN